MKKLIIALSLLVFILGSMETISAQRRPTRKTTAKKTTVSKKIKPKKKQIIKPVPQLTITTPVINNTVARGNGSGKGNGNGSGSGIGDGEGNGNNEIIEDSKIQKPKINNLCEGETKSVFLISKPQPLYTDEARKNNVQGTIMLKVTFNANGTIGAVSPVTSLPYGLTEQAIAAARKIKFQPQMKCGQPVAVTKTVQYTLTIY